MATDSDRPRCHGLEFQIHTFHYSNIQTSGSIEGDILPTSPETTIAERRYRWRRRRLDRWIGLALFVWIIAFYDPFDLIGSSAPGSNISYLDQVSSSIRAGSRINQLLILSLAVFGAVYFFEGARWLIRSRSRAIIALLAYCLWAVATFAWSVDPSLTTRRVGELWIIALASVGIGAGFYGAREDGEWRLVRDSLIVGGVAVVSVWMRALLRGNIAPFSPGWSLVEVGAATQFGVPIAYCWLLAVHGRITGRWANRIPPRLLSAFILGASITLVSLRKRTLLLGAILIGAWLIVRLYSAARRRSAVARVILAASTLLILAWTFGADPIEGLILPVVTRGEELGQLTSLTGRVPLWTHLLTEFASSRPLTGVGYGAFWRPETLNSVWADVGWPATTAHNAFLEELLRTGIIGLLIILLFWTVSFVLLLRAARRMGAEDLAVTIAAWIGLLGFTALTSTTLQDWDQLTVIMPLVATMAWLVWVEKKTHPASGLIAR